jgi:hypothetical protein
MKMQARQSILDMWHAAARFSYTKEQVWNWGGRRPPNCIDDAEQLLVLLYPATTISSLALESVDEDRSDVLRALRAFGGAQAIPRALVRGAKEYLLTYRDEDGNPTFAGGSYFRTPGPETEAVARQRQLDVVDAYSMSLTFCLTILGFLRVYRRNAPDSLEPEIEEIDRLASVRLSAAMVGLLRSFAVHTFTQDSEPGQSLLMMANQARTSPQSAVRSLNLALDEVRLSLRLSLADGSTEAQRRQSEDFDETNDLFECGWSWGVVDGTPTVSWALDRVPYQPDGYAEERPNTYFTVSAMDGIRDLFTERTRMLGLLTVDQQRLAAALQNRLNITQQYWTKLATFGEAQQWPIEDLPWRTTDGSESDYHSLLLSAIVIQGLGADERTTGPEARRIAQLLRELAMRAKITRRSVADDPAVKLHLPGLSMPLAGSEKVGEVGLEWVVSSFSMLLLKQVVQAATRIESSSERSLVLQEADRIWEHLQKRRLSAGEGRELWDAPGNVYAEAPEPGLGTAVNRPSWYHTERVMEALVQAALTIGTNSEPTPEVAAVAQAVLAEAENLLDRELLRGTPSADQAYSRTEEITTARFAVRGIQTKVRRARSLLASQPGTSLSLAEQALRELDEIVAARQRS